jgi:hypothetical protein
MVVGGQLHAPVALTPGKETPLSIGLEATRAPELVWTRWRREKFLPSGKSNPGVSARSLVTIVTHIYGKHVSNYFSLKRDGHMTLSYIAK